MAHYGSAPLEMWLSCRPPGMEPFTTSGPRVLFDRAGVVVRRRWLIVGGTILRGGRWPALAPGRFLNGCGACPARSRVQIQASREYHSLCARFSSFLGASTVRRREPPWRNSSGPWQAIVRLQPGGLKFDSAARRGAPSPRPLPPPRHRTGQHDQQRADAACRNL